MLSVVTCVCVCLCLTSHQQMSYGDKATTLRVIWQAGETWGLNLWNFSYKVYLWQFLVFGPQGQKENCSIPENIIYTVRHKLSITWTLFQRPGPVPYFRGDWPWNNFYGHSPPFRWFIQEGLLSFTSESMCTNYWLTACSSLPRKMVWLGELTVPQWP